MQELRGIAVSPGVAIGEALVMDNEGFRIPRRFVARDAVEAELERLGRAIAAASEEELTAVEEVGPVIAASVHQFFHSPPGRRTLKRVKAAGVTLSAPRRPRATAAAPLAGKTVVVTGTLEKLSRSEAEAAIKAAGGRATSSVSKTTDFVVVGAGHLVGENGLINILDGRGYVTEQLYDLD